MRVFVTGGAGFIGANFVRWVLAHTEDVRVTNFDKLTYAGNLDNLRGVSEDPRYTFVRGDICDAGHLREAMADHDAVVNFAAESHVDRSIDGPAEFLMTNVVGAGAVFEAARHHGVERVLHVSTDEVYGSVPAPSSSREGDPLEPNSPYSASKASADLLARAYGHTYDHPVIVTRAANNFGPYQHPEKAIPLFITNLMAGEPVPLYGDGSNVRDWTYVRDNAAAQWLVLTEGRPGAVYNVGAGNTMTNRELVGALLKRFDAGEEMIEHVTDRPGHDQRYSLDCSRIRDELGWSPGHGFEEALDATVAWYRDNGWWWRPLAEAGASRRRGLARRSG